MKDTVTITFDEIKSISNDQDLGKYVRTLMIRVTKNKVNETPTNTFSPNEKLNS
jgi:hypothetical protein